MLQILEYLHPHKFWKYSEEDDRTGDQEIIEARKGQPLSKNNSNLSVIESETKICDVKLTNIIIYRLGVKWGGVYRKY